MSQKPSLVSGPPPLWGTAADGISLVTNLYSWSKTSLGHRVFQGFLDSLNTKIGTNFNFESWAGGVLGPFRDAPVYLVTREMSNLLLKAAESMDDQRLLESDLPSPDGVMILSEYLTFKEVHGKTCRTCAMSWKSVQYPEVDGRFGVLVGFWSDMQDPLDEVNQGIFRDVLERHSDMLGQLPRLSLLHFTAFEFGKTLKESEREEGQKESVKPDYLVLVAFFAMCQQRVAVRETAHLPRQIRRGIERKTKSKVQEIQVVTLRRAVPKRPHSDHDPIGVNWDHRWIVGGATGGFWRQQWYPSLQDHRQIWIDPFVKGPEDKPLLVKDQVFKLRR